MLVGLTISVITMISKHNFRLLITFFIVSILSTNAMAAGKCASVRTESTFELINAPAEEMLNSRNSTAVTCVFLKDFISRLNAKAGSLDLPRTDIGAYIPKTKDDNSPWRFDMSQNGKRMTSVEFDAWMKAKGIRVATGKAGAEGPAPLPECTPSQEIKC